ncbi:protease-4 [Balneicella halophila]|uniref:Protease-4 n=1 Tax=Balneicella halophila TaxID=1537566 RepID=A0A7L4UNI4_BALHA|nr:signal peptide peptidase SppA [Balneicella halophila]PVX50102.1 protease-4 [Balneicella halophila]
MKFLRNLIAAILGSMIGIFLLFFLMIMFFAVIGSMSDNEVKVKKNSVLTLDFTKEIKDRVENNPFSGMDFGPFASESAISLNSILLSIEKAKDDDRIEGIVLKAPQVIGNYGGTGFLKEIRNKLEEFKEAGKFVYAYNKQGYSQNGYWLSSVADSVFMHPQGGIMINGFGGSMPFFPIMFEKIGVEPEIIRHGKFKAAVEPFMLTEMSPENREQTMKYVNSLWNDFLTDVSASRSISTEQLNQWADDLTIRNPETALKYHLVDALYHPDEFTAFLKNKLGIKSSKDDKKKDKKIEYISLSDYKKVNVKSEDKIGKDDDIAVIYAEGEIADLGNGITPELAEVIADVRKDDDIKAVVLRVNSPGGSALVSEYILREMKLLKEEKPVVVSFGNVAASGGYYIACAADTIVAEPTTITGSIGVFGLFFTGKELVEDKIGIRLDSYGTNEHSNFGGGASLPIASRRLTDFERNIIQESVEDVYDVFISHVAEGRNMTKEQVDEIGQGRVWIGRDAKEIGLVDKFGGLVDAIDVAKRMANIEGKARIHMYPKKKDPFQEFIETLSNQSRIALLKNELGSNYTYYKQVQDVMSFEGIQARLPYELSAH